MWSWLTAPQRWMSYTTSSVWSWFTGTERASRPTVYDLTDVAYKAAEVARAYSGDPLKGYLDFSEHPGRIEFHRQRRSLNTLALDCDDVAGYTKWLLDGANWCKWAKVINVYDAWDFNRANYTHAVCWFELQDGTRGFIDTNVIWGDPEKSYRGPYIGSFNPTQYCQAMYGSMGANFLLYEEAPWPFG